MKIVRTERLIDVGGFSGTQEWKTIENHVTNAIKAVEWPPDSGSFTLFAPNLQGQGSGVKPIKDACMLHLKSLGWDLETRTDIATLRKPGPMDASFQVGGRLFCVEWETGNISSSHRAMNKMALGILKKTLIGGIPYYCRHGGGGCGLLQKGCGESQNWSRISLCGGHLPSMKASWLLLLLNRTR